MRRPALAAPLRKSLPGVGLTRNALPSTFPGARRGVAHPPQADDWIVKTVRQVSGTVQPG
jgi:hypothetical protein